MQRIRTRIIWIVAAALTLFLALQAWFLWQTFSARAVTQEYLSRSVFDESLDSRQPGFYANGRDRYTIQIPPFDEKFRMHSAMFQWNENRFVPPDAESKPGDILVGTCLLTPRSPWRQLDLFGVLGPFECRLYGDWRVESDR